MSEVLHSSLLKGTLSIKVSGTDIRRVATGITGTSAIETDYILRISPTNTVTFKKTSTSSLNVDELKAYHCSKRYVDLRHLAKSMQEHAVEVIKFYAKKGGNEHDHYVGKGALVKNVKEFAHFITNTEKSKSSVATDLDSLFNKKGKKSLSTGDIDVNNTHRLTSSVLTEGAPIYIRKVLEGVDDFFECIFTEKRQFGGKKTNIDYVKNVATRRQKIIDDAFQKFLDALTHADLDGKIKSQLVPKSMMELIKSMEKFLLTDVLKDTATEQVQNSGSSGSLSSEDYVDVNNSPPSTPPQDEAPARGRPGMVKAMSVRHRMSGVDREEEEKECALVDELVLAESVDEKDHEIKATPSSSPNANEGRKKNAVHPPPPMEGLLSDDPFEFAIILVAGTVFFKLLQGRTAELQMDVLASFGLACGLIGYQLAARNDTTELVVDYSPTRKRVHVAEPTFAGESRSRPPMMRSSTGSRMLLQKSALIMKSMRFSSISDDDDERDEAAPLKTFDMFPEGAKIGSHLNCWSSPPSTNFHVRGPNYIKDKKKVPSADYIFPTRGVDLFLTDNPPVNIGRYDGILNGKLREKPTFIINYRLPWGVFISYHEIPDRFIPFLRKRHGHGNSDVPLPSMEGMSAGEQAMCNFLLSDTEEKNEVLKIVPVIVEGPWVVKKVVGGKPAIIGTKLPISYVYQPPEKGLCEYLEADLDIVSSAAARNILAVVRSYTQVLTIDLGFVVQGNTNQYLPEQMILGLRLHGLDPLTAELLPETHDDVPHLTDDGNETD